MALRLNGSTSGYVELNAAATSASNTLTLPNGNGSSGQFLQTNGSGTLSWAGAGVAAHGFTTSNGGSASSDTVISSFSSLDFSNHQDKLLYVFGRSTIQENSNTADSAVLYVEMTNGTNTIQIAGSRNGNPHGGWGGNFQLEIVTSGLYVLPSTYATSNITLRLRANINSGQFWYGDQSSYSAFDNIGSGISGGITFQYMIFG